jgi:hypothetical protein
MPLVLASMLLAALTESVQLLPDFVTGGKQTQASILALDNGSPVAEIGKFTGTRQGRDVLLEWQTQNEQHVLTYEIQRASSASRGWERIGLVAAANGRLPQTYTFLDRNVPAEDVRYLLRIHGRNGEIVYSDIIVARLNSVIRSFSVAPEPSGRVNTYVISIGVNKPGPVELLLSDEQGRTIEKIYAASELPTGQHTFSLDGSRLSAGSYAVKLQTADGDFSRSVILGK